MQRRGIAVAPPFERQLLDMFARCDDRGIVSWGAGIRACLGRHVAPIVLAEAVRAFAQLPRLELRRFPAWWPEAAVPSPPEIEGRRDCSATWMRGRKKPAHPAATSKRDTFQPKMLTTGVAPWSSDGS